MKTYRVNEIFYSVQGEGFWTGLPAVFLRFSICNLRCPFCDTDFAGGQDMSAEQILDAVRKAGEGKCDTVVITGGEPALQIDGALVSLLHEEGFLLHIETNGTKALPDGIDWITLSPKSDWQKGAEPVLARADELKLVYTGQENPERWLGYPARHFFLQPCSGKNTAEVLDYILKHPGSSDRPAWRLSLQIHKYFGIP